MKHKVIYNLEEDGNVRIIYIECLDKLETTEGVQVFREAIAKFHGLDESKSVGILSVEVSPTAVFPLIELKGFEELMQEGSKLKMTMTYNKGE